MEKIAISVTEAAAALGIGRSHAYEMVRKGNIKSVKLGSKILIPVSELQKLLSVSEGDKS